MEKHSLERKALQVHVRRKWCCANGLPGSSYNGPQEEVISYGLHVPASGALEFMLQWLSDAVE
jgi:hypothetical protein